ASMSGASVRHVRGFILKVLSQGRIMLIPDQLATVRDLGEQIIQTGNHKNADERSHEHPADGGGADGSISDCPGTRGADEGNETGDEREGRHHDRSEAEVSAFDGCFPES